MDERDDKNAIKIVKVKIFDEQIKEITKDMVLEPNDLVVVEITKIEGSPIQFLQDRYLKPRDSPDDALPVQDKNESSECTCEFCSVHTAMRL